MKMRNGISLCGLLLCGSVFAQDIVVRQTQNINVTIGSDTYHAVYDKSNGILVVTKNKGFRLGPLIKAKEKNENSVDSSISESTENTTRARIKAEPGTNPLADIFKRSQRTSR